MVKIGPVIFFFNLSFWGWLLKKSRTIVTQWAVDDGSRSVPKEG